MSEFLKHVLVLGMLSVMAFAQGLESPAPSGSPTAAAGTAVTVALKDSVTASLEDIAAPSGSETLSPRVGVAAVQADPGSVSRLEIPRSMGNPSRAQREGPTQDEAPASIAPTTELACRFAPTQGYGLLSIRGGPTERPAALHPDLNLGQRAWTVIGAPLSLQNVGGPTDGGAPRFSSLFAPSRVPRITGAYQVFNWDFRSGRRTTPITSPEVTLAGFATAPGETLLLPESGYGIGDGFSALVLYADVMRLTMKYTREDNVAVGYTLHLENICVDPRLLASYRDHNAAGRWKLPAVRSGQPVGTAVGTQLLAGIQDSGSWMDPRSRKDWWQ